MVDGKTEALAAQAVLAGTTRSTLPLHVIARSEATKQSRLSPRRDSGLLRCARN